MKNLHEKIKAAMLAYGVGDALGLATDYMTPKEVEHHYPNGLETYDDMIADAHRAVWIPGEGTNDSRMLYMLASIIGEYGYPNPEAYAKRLYKWYREGQIDISATLRRLLEQPSYLDNPIQTAHDLWVSMGKMSESNDCIGLMVAVGICKDDPVGNSQAITDIFHGGPRSHGASATMATVVNRLFWDDYVLTRDEVLDITNLFSAELAEYVNLAYNGGEPLKALVGDSNYPSDVRKTLAAGLAALWHGENLEHTLMNIVQMGGDANNNAALACALMGLRFGMSAIPQRLIDDRRNMDIIDRVSKQMADAVLK